LQDSFASLHPPGLATVSEIIIQAFGTTPVLSTVPSNDPPPQIQAASPTTDNNPWESWNVNHLPRSETELAESFG
jgi:hypothetical protein